jgi:hypothetical protein
MMKKYFDRLAVLVASAWVGGMWTAGYVAAPVLFQSLPDKALAGVVAGKLFAVAAYMGLYCALYLLIYFYLARGKQVLHQGVFWIVIVMLALTLIGQFGMQPLLADLKAQALPQYVMESSYAGQFRFWHGASSIIFLVQSLLGVALLLKVYGQK